MSYPHRATMPADAHPARSGHLDPHARRLYVPESLYRQYAAVARPRSGRAHLGAPREPAWPVDGDAGRRSLPPNPRAPSEPADTAPRRNSDCKGERRDQSPPQANCRRRPTREAGHHPRPQFDPLRHPRLLGVAPTRDPVRLRDSRVLGGRRRGSRHERRRFPEVPRHPRGRNPPCTPRRRIDRHLRGHPGRARAPWGR